MSLPDKITFKKKRITTDHNSMENTQPATEIILANEEEKNLSTLFDGHAPRRNPAIAYLLNLRSEDSRTVMFSFLNIVAKVIGFHSLHDCQWQDLRRHHVQMIVNNLIDSGRAPATINTYLYAIKGVAYEAQSMELMDRQDYERIKEVKRVEGSRLAKGRALKKAEVRALFDSCRRDGSARGVRDLAILSILVGSGLRRAEIVALNFENINLNDSYLKVLGKGNREREAYLPTGAWEHLYNWLSEVRGHHEGSLFYRIRKNDDVTGERLSTQAVHYILNERRLEAGLDDMSPHDLRRTFASTLLANGEDLITVRDLMGHSSVKTTEIYDHRGNEHLRSASERMNTMFKG